MNRQRSHRARTIVPWVWTGLVVVTCVVLLAWNTAFLDGFVDSATAIGFLLLSVLFTGLAALIVTRQPGNQISLLMFAIGFGLLVDTGVAPLVEAQPVSPSLLDYLAIFVSNTAWQFFLFPLFLLLFLFPTGRFLTRRWTWALWLTALMAVAGAFFNLFTVEIGPPGGQWVVPNPIGFVPASTFDSGPAGLVVNLGLVALALGGLIAVDVRYRRSSQLIRTQIKWVLYGAFGFAVVYAFFAFSQVWTDDSNLLGLLLVGSMASIPISITIAITHYRLFEIDRIISRTLTYTAVVVMLGALFIGMVTLVTSMLPAQSSLAVAGATLAVAALFNPFRRRIQHAVDRRFNRSSYQARVISERFAATLQDSLTVEEIAESWTTTVEEALQPEASGIWLNQT